MFENDSERPEHYRQFEHPTPDWYRDAKLGIFVHWGPFSVPAWAEPIGALGTIDMTYWFAHNPYAEWYFNTIRIEGSPAAEHQKEVYGGAEYDDFLDQWTASEFDAADVMALVKETGAGYFVPTTKHHDGVTLWDAPGTDKRNTVHRGPKRDLIGEFADAARAQGIHFGVYYSGGLDWHFGQNPPIVDDTLADNRPVDAAYAEYAHDHVVDLIERYRPDVLWGDIEWPDAGKAPGPASLVDVFERFYAASPDGVVNDRWGETHWDFRTSEYENGREVEGSATWENCRGVGFSFGYNQLEDDSTSLSGAGAVTHFVDVVSRGGNFLLNIGLTAEGTVPGIQRQTLTELGRWNAINGASIFGSTTLDADVAAPSETPWVRWTSTSGHAHAFVVSDGAEVTLALDPARVDVASAHLVDGTPVAVSESGALTLPSGDGYPTQVTFDLTR